jgi:hypothetical protein
LILSTACTPLGLQDKEIPLPIEKRQNLPLAFEKNDMVSIEAKVRQDPRYFEVRYRNGYLEISTPQVLERLRKTLTNQTKEELELWERQFDGFISQQAILEKAKSEEKRHYDAKVARNVQVKDESNSTYFLNHVDLLSITRSQVSLKLGVTSMAKFVNSDGIVRIAGHLFQYGSNFIKIIIDGDDRKLSLLNVIHQTDILKGIVVIPVSNSLRPLGSARVEQNGFDDDQTGFNPNFPFTASYWYSALRASDFAEAIYDYSQEPYWECNAANGWCYPVYPITGYTNYTVCETYCFAEARHFLFGWSGTQMNFTIGYSSNITGSVSPASFSNVSSASRTIYQGPQTIINASSTHTAQYFFISSTHSLFI